MARMSGGEAVAKTLQAAGVEFVFGMTVGGQAPFTVAVIQSGMRLMTVRDEKCASLMATGYSKVSGKPGVCIASNPGAAHLALGMYEAHLSGNAIVAITSDPAPAGRWRQGADYLDQQALFQPLTKWTVRADSLESLPDIISSALRVSTTGRPGPVAVIVPNPLWAGESDFEIGPETQIAQHPAMRPVPAMESIEKAAELLFTAEKPAIVAGGGVMLSGCSSELLELAELQGSPVATTHVAHGSFPSGHPLSVGVLGNPNAGNRGRIANKIVGDADVVLLVGTRMDAATTRGHTILSPNAKIIQIDIDPQEIGSSYGVEVGIAADAKLALQALKSALAAKVEWGPSIQDTSRVDEIAAMTDEWRREFGPQMSSDAVPIKTPRLFREIQGLIDEDTIVVLDAGSCSYWAPAYLDLAPDNQSLYPRGIAALGSGFPMAVGAQAAAPNKKVISISGDGAFGYNIMELETAVRLNLPVVNIVINNQSLGMERRGYLEYVGEVPPEAASFSPQDFSKIAQAYNCFGVRAERPEEIRGAIAAALASGRPAVVDVVTDPEDSDSEATRPWRSY